MVRPGVAVFNFTMKSGTNQFHGSAFEYMVNEDLNAAGAYSHTDPKSRRNDYGGTAGAPIWIPKVYNGKDKTFFFFSYESSPTTTVSPNTQNTVPTAAYRIGDFSAIDGPGFNKILGTDLLGRNIIQNTIYDPLTQGPVSSTNSQLIRNPFPNNLIPKTQLDPVALKIQALVPTPQGVNATQSINNYINPFTTKTQAYIPSIKIDHALSSKIKLSGFWGWTHSATPGDGVNTTSEGLPSPITTFAPTAFDTINYRLNYDHSLTPTMLLHLGGAYQTSALDMPSFITGYNATTQLGLTGPFTPLGFPIIGGGQTATLAGGMTGANSLGGLAAVGSFGAPSGIGSTPFGGTVNTREQKTTFVASLTWIRGNHSFKFGGETRIEGYPNANIINTNGSYAFGPAETGLPYLNASSPPGQSNTIGFPYASFLLGMVNNYNIAQPAIGRLGKNSSGFYAQDSWKVTRKLSLEIGLRYDYSTYQREQYGRFGSFSTKVPNLQDGGHPGGVVYEATCGCNFAKNYPYALGPRLGFAYQVASKTVIRGGAGILYNGTPANNVLTRQVTSRNIVSSTSWAQPVMTLANGVPLTPSQIAYPNFSASYFPVTAIPGTPGPAPMYQIDPNAGRPSRSYQWSIGVQREIFKDLVVDVSYVGNRGIWWPTSTPVNYNALTPQDLLNDGLDISTLAARNILNAQIGSAAAGPFQGKLPYAGFPLTATVAQSLRPFPQFTTAPTALWAPLGDTWYNSLQLKVTKRFSHGLDFAYNFTWAQELETASKPTAPVPSERPPKRTTYSMYLSTYSRPLVSNISFSYTVPKWGGNKILRQVLGDWQVGALMTYASGMPILVPTSTNQLANQLFRPTFMNRVPGVPLYTVDVNCRCYDPTKTLVLNPAAWVDPPAGTFGNSTAFYNDYRQQRRPVENFNMGRNFTFKERFSFSVRAEFVNMFNRTILPNPSATTPGTAATCFLSGIKRRHRGLPRRWWLDLGLGLRLYADVQHRRRDEDRPARRAF